MIPYPAHVEPGDGALLLDAALVIHAGAGRGQPGTGVGAGHHGTNRADADTSDIRNSSDTSPGPSTIRLRLDPDTGLGAEAYAADGCLGCRDRRRHDRGPPIRSPDAQSRRSQPPPMTRPPPTTPTPTMTRPLHPRHELAPPPPDGRGCPALRLSRHDARCRAAVLLRRGRVRRHRPGREPQAQPPAPDLSDDQGWRLQIDAWPRLTGPATDASGGFYSKDDYRRIVEHAAARHMTVVPEIDMPGHTHAVGIAYPRTGRSPGDHRNVARAGRRTRSGRARGGCAVHGVGGGVLVLADRR